MDCSALLHLRYFVRPIGDHAEVSHSFQSSYTNRLSQTQGVRRDGEESLDRLLPLFYVFRTGCSRDSECNPICLTLWYGLSLPPEANI